MLLGTLCRNGRTNQLACIVMVTGLIDSDIVRTQLKSTSTPLMFFLFDGGNVGGDVRPTRRDPSTLKVLEAEAPMVVCECFLALLGCRTTRLTERMSARCLPYSSVIVTYRGPCIADCSID